MTTKYNICSRLNFVLKEKYTIQDTAEQWMKLEYRL